MTQVEIINEALKKVHEPKIPSDEAVEEWGTTLDLFYETLISNRAHKWLFTYEILSDITEQTEAVDLGFKYKYLMPANTMAVLDISGGTSRFRPEYYNDPRKSLEVGLQLDYPDEVGLEQSRPHFTTGGQHIFTNGVLHTDLEAKKVLIQKKVPYEDLESTFSFLLILTLAHDIAVNLGKHELASTRNRQRKAQFRLAVAAQDKLALTNPYYAELYAWLQKMYSVPVGYGY